MCLKYNRSRTDKQSTSKNPSPHVARLASPKYYLLTLPLEGTIKNLYLSARRNIERQYKTPLAADIHLASFYPASRYGIEVPSFTPPLVP